jgi:hypothetical protein
MGVTIDGVWISELNLLATCTLHLELHVVNSTIGNLHTLQITTAPAKPFSSLLCLQQLFPTNSF